jgi:hypothetical protein
MVIVLISLINVSLHFAYQDSHFAITFRRRHAQLLYHFVILFHDALKNVTTVSYFNNAAISLSFQLNAALAATSPWLSRAYLGYRITYINYLYLLI